MSTNITWHPGLTRTERESLRGQKGFTIWLTGLSASGKSTIATALEQHLLHNNISAYRLDGDNVRFGLNKDLGFSEGDRNENIRRIAEVPSPPTLWTNGEIAPTTVSKLFADSSTIAITSFISPYIEDRIAARELHSEIPFIEVHVDIPVSVAEQRDPKGLYKKARAGEIKDFTGISAPYEAPEYPEIRVQTDKVSVEEAVKIIVDYLQEKGLVKLGA
ncbi:unnamed protein product [Tuber aestivum]|uniref:Adenylyl-sulfate kinase n=1 Tax=Tuber aestivum TaxID=59557 RepID=A0A292PKF7_9PEZI|nr:unnamed protein product [Tuber aestivum]